MSKQLRQKFLKLDQDGLSRAELSYAGLEYLFRCNNKERDNFNKPQKGENRGGQAKTV